MRHSGFLLVSVLCCAVAVSDVVAETEVPAYLRSLGIDSGDFAMRDVAGWRQPQRILAPNWPTVVEAFEAADIDAELVLFDSVAEGVQKASNVDALFGACSADIVAAAERLLWVQSFTAGVERCVGSEKIRSGEVVLSNAQKVASPVIAEHALAMVLALGRALPRYQDAMADGEWVASRDLADQMQTFGGKTLLVAGLGGIGTQVARLAAALDMRVIATRRSSRRGPDFVSYVGLADELEALAAEADFIVNALPLTPATTGLFDKQFFDAAKKGAIFVSVGRGKSVVTDDLLAAVESGQLAGAGLDVTDPEPLPPDHPLWQEDNVIITPHVATIGMAPTAYRMLLVENLKRFAAGDAVLNVVDPERGY